MRSLLRLSDHSVVTGFEKLEARWLGALVAADSRRDATFACLATLFPFYNQNSKWNNWFTYNVLQCLFFFRFVLFSFFFCHLQSIATISLNLCGWQTGAKLAPGRSFFNLIHWSKYKHRVRPKTPLCKWSGCNTFITSCTKGTLWQVSQQAGWSEKNMRVIRISLGHFFN